MENWQKKLRNIRENNNTAAWAMAEYIDGTPTAITPSLMREADPEGRLEESALYAAFMSGFSGIDERDREVSDYFHNAVRRLELSDYESNPYLRTIRFPDAHSSHWKFTHYSYKPYEAFVRDDIVAEPSSREVPQIGYFRERYVFPAVEQNHREWMAVKPSEIASMQPAVDTVSGRVLTFGLGLGYFAFMASMKDTVESVDIVERDAEAIGLFSRHILPQFPNSKKIRIIQKDAFDFMSEDMAGEHDFAFVDLWHDTSDGLELYLKSKKMENALRRKGIRTRFLYWVERSLLSAYRWTRFDEILGDCSTEEEALFRLSDEELRRSLDSL